MRFYRKYYNDFSFDYWQNRLDYELNRLVDEGESISPSAIIGAYSSYLQLAEIVFHHMYLLTRIKDGDEAFKKAIFIGNLELKRWIEEACDKEFISSVLDSFVFATNPKPKNHKEKRRDYLRALTESRYDFLNNHDALNAFKHGFRLEARKGGIISINGQQVMAPDGAISYLKKENGIVYRISLGFSVKRVIAKAHFLLSTIENTRRLILAEPGSEIEQEHYFIDDMKTWETTFGGYSFKEPV